MIILHQMSTHNQAGSSRLKKKENDFLFTGMKVNTTTLSEPVLWYHCLRCDVGGCKVCVNEVGGKSEQTPAKESTPPVATRSGVATVLLTADYLSYEKGFWESFKDLKSRQARQAPSYSIPGNSLTLSTQTD